MNNRLHCFNKLEELFSLYDKVRQSVILLENFNEEQKMYIAPINQLRSALDHIFKAINICDDFEQCEYELIEAKEHLDRAGYDSLELLAYFDQISILINIDKKVDTMIPSLEEYEKKKKKERLKTWGISILSSIISGLLVGIIMYFVTI